jgi:hypothetical protein
VLIQLFVRHFVHIQLIISHLVIQLLILFLRQLPYRIFVCFCTFFVIVFFFFFFFLIFIWIFIFVSFIVLNSWLQLWLWLRTLLFAPSVVASVVFILSITIIFLQYRFISYLFFHFRVLTCS